MFYIQTCTKVIQYQNTSKMYHHIIVSLLLREGHFLLIHQRHSENRRNTLVSYNGIHDENVQMTSQQSTDCIGAGSALCWRQNLFVIAISSASVKLNKERFPFLVCIKYVRQFSFRIAAKFHSSDSF